MSRKKSLKTSNKELQDLTNLIRKTKNSPHIANAKHQSRNRDVHYNTMGDSHNVREFNYLSVA